MFICILKLLCPLVIRIIYVLTVRITLKMKYVKSVKYSQHEIAQICSAFWSFICDCSLWLSQMLGCCCVFYRQWDRRRWCFAGECEQADGHSSRIHRSGQKRTPCLWCLLWEWWVGWFLMFKAHCPEVHFLLCTSSLSHSIALTLNWDYLVY